MGVQQIPAAEVDVDEDLVRRLLLDQHPDLADRRLTLLANGWDNVVVRIGDDLVARLPRRQMGADLVANEQRWLSEIARRLPIPIPAPVRVGGPGHGYPWAWSICAFFDGEVAADTEISDPEREARRLGEFLAALHVKAPADAPANPFRGHPVGELADRFEANLDTLAGDGRVDRRAVRRRWDELLDVGEWDGPPLWIHGDLHVANMIVRDGEIAAVIDFGDITAADPAVDFAVAWMLFGPAERAVLRAGAGARWPVDDATWQRAAAWALHFAVLYLMHSADSERFERMGISLLESVLAATDLGR